MEKTVDEGIAGDKESASSSRRQQRAKRERKVCDFETKGGGF